jgi:DNA polymerase
MGITPWVERRAPHAPPKQQLPADPAVDASPQEPALPAIPGPGPGASADDAAIALMDWDTLRETVRVCRRCGLHEGRTQAVFGVGPVQTDWLVIGEAPGAEEDRQGEPFVGRAGQLLDAMLAALGLDRNTAYIANVLKCRPPNNRDPEPAEAEHCAPFLDRQIALIRPRVILAVGRIAAQRLLGTDAPLGRLRGQVHAHGPDRLPVVVTYHPAYLLRRPSEKGKVWRDLLFARRQLDSAT